MSADQHYPFPEEAKQEAQPVYSREVNAYIQSKAERSESIAKLAGALAKAQISFKPIKKEVENIFYTTDRKKAMYADLAAVIAATQRPLAENGLVVIQSPIIRPETKEAGVRSMLVHESGEWLSNEVVLPATAKVKDYAATGGTYTWGVKFDAQTCGIAITYSRRYSYQSLIGVAAEEDDDANSIGEPSSGSKEAAQTVAKIKLAAKGATIPSLFYTHHAESNTYEVTGTEELKTANKDLLKKFWSPTAGALLLNDEQLEGLKWELEQRKVPFTALKEK